MTLTHFRLKTSVFVSFSGAGANQERSVHHHLAEKQHVWDRRPSHRNLQDTQHHQECRHQPQDHHVPRTRRHHGLEEPGPPLFFSFFRPCKYWTVLFLTWTAAILYYPIINKCNVSNCWSCWIIAYSLMREHVFYHHKGIFSPLWCHKVHLSKTACLKRRATKKRDWTSLISGEFSDRWDIRDILL